MILVQSSFTDTNSYSLPGSYKYLIVSQGSTSVCGKVYWTEKVVWCKMNSFIDFESKNVILVQASLLTQVPSFYHAAMIVKW